MPLGKPYPPLTQDPMALALAASQNAGQDRNRIIMPGDQNYSVGAPVDFRNQPPSGTPYAGKNPQVQPQGGMLGGLPASINGGGTDLAELQSMLMAKYAAQQGGGQQEKIGWGGGGGDGTISRSMAMPQSAPQLNTARAGAPTAPLVAEEGEGGGFGSLLGDLGMLGVGAFGTEDLLDNAKRLNDDVQTKVTQLQADSETNTKFSPYTVTSGAGNMGFNQETGEVSLNQNQTQQDMTNSANTGALAAYDAAGIQDPNLAAQMQALSGMGTSANTDYTNFQGAAGPSDDFETLRKQTMSKGLTDLGNITANQDIEALKTSFLDKAKTSANALGDNRATREADVYSRIRAMQAPEEQRQDLALRDQLFAQGRGGVSTAQYGGTPEQLAREKARAEAMNSASLQAMSQAGVEMGQDLSQAQGITGLGSGLLGQQDALMNSAQARASELSGLGMSAAQVQSQLESEGLGRTTSAQNNVFAGMNQGQGMQANDLQRRAAEAGLGNLFQTSGMMGDNQLLNQLQITNQLSEIGAANQRQGAQNSTELGLGGIEAMVGSQQAQADILKQLYATGGQVAGSAGNALGGYLSNLAGSEGGGGILSEILGDVGGIFGSILGGGD